MNRAASRSALRPTLPPTLVHGMLDASADEFGDRVLLVDGDDEHRYDAVRAAANRVAATLIDIGVVPGDRVALLAANSLFWVTAYHGILEAGAVVVPVASTAHPDDVRTCVTHCGASVIVVGSSCERRLAPVLAGLSSVHHVVTEGPSRLVESSDARVPSGLRIVDLSIADAGVLERRVPISPDDLASIVYTSGSTGRSRGVMLSHANLVANVASIVDYMGLTERDRALAVLPFSYVFGASVLNTHVAVGGSVVIENRFMYPTTAVDTLQQTSCTSLPGVPSTFQILLDSTDLAQRDLPSLRAVHQAGGAMSPATTKRLIDALPDVDIFVMYGCTEASARLAYLPPQHLADHLGQVGHAIPGVTLDVRRDDGTVADVDEVGELVARGPNIMRGYWDDPDATASVLDDLGLHTGDLATRDVSGYLTIVGRTGDMIKSGGHRVSPLEIEAVLAEHPQVARVAVVGRSDDLLGEAIVAIVVPRVESTDRAGSPVDRTVLAGDIRAHAAGRLPRHKVPVDVIFRDALPVSDVGKILRRELRDELSSS